MVDINVPWLIRFSSENDLSWYMLCGFSQQLQTNAGTIHLNRTHTGKLPPGQARTQARARVHTHTHTHTHNEINICKDTDISFSVLQEVDLKILGLNVTDGEHVCISSSALHNLCTWLDNVLSFRPWMQKWKKMLNMGTPNILIFFSNRSTLQPEAPFHC
jgi:hypothetical protein